MTDFSFKNIDDNLKRQQKEYRLQCAVADQIPKWYPGLIWWHTPNRPGSGTDGFHKKRMGARAGVTDLIFLWRSQFGLEVGLIELKADDGTLSNDQNRFISACDALGCHTGVGRSCRDVHSLLRSWGLKTASNAIVEPDYRTDSEKKQADHDFFKP